MRRSGACLLRGMAAVVLAFGSAASCGPSVYQTPRDDGSWLGIAETAAARTYLDARSIQDSAGTVVALLRIVYTAAPKTSVERRITARIDCSHRVALIVSQRIIGRDGSEHAALGPAPTVQSFADYGDDIPFAQACVRLGKSPGRLAPH